MEINESNAGGYHILEVFTYVDVYNSSKLKNILNTITELRHSNLAVCLHGNKEHMDSSVISALLSAHKKTIASGFAFALVVDNDDIINLLILAGLKNYFTIFHSLDDLKRHEQ